MPTMQLPIYLTDEEYVKYVQNKEQLIESIKEHFRKELEKVER